MIQKNILAFLILCGLIFPVAARDIALEELNPQSIKKHAETVAGELRRNAWHKRLSAVVGLCAATYGTYHLFFKNSPEAAAHAAALASPAAHVQEKASALKRVATSEEIQRLSNALEKNESLLNNIFEQQQKNSNTGVAGTIKTWGTSTFSFILRESAVAVACSMVMGAFGKYFRAFDNVIDSATYKVFHPGNLQWYIKTHSSIYSVLNDLESHAYCIEHKRLPKKVNNDGIPQVVAEVMLNEEQVAYHIRAFATTWALCARELESILGFMWMKAQEVGKEGSESARLKAQRFTEIIDHVYDLASNFITKAQALTGQYDTSRSGLVQEVNQLRLLFMEERSAFMGCERA